MNNDSEIFNKWSQALSSADDLVDNGYYEAERLGHNLCCSCVLPVLVVPDKTLWHVDYDEKGNRLCDPKPFDRCSYFINMDYSPGGGLAPAEYNISHIEIVTLKGLKGLTGQLLEQNLNPLFGWGEFKVPS